MGFRDTTADFNLKLRACEKTPGGKRSKNTGSWSRSFPSLLHAGCFLPQDDLEKKFNLLFLHYLLCIGESRRLFSRMPGHILLPQTERFLTALEKLFLLLFSF